MHIYVDNHGCTCVALWAECTELTRVTYRRLRSSHEVEPEAAATGASEDCTQVQDG